MTDEQLKRGEAISHRINKIRYDLEILKDSRAAYFVCRTKGGQDKYLSNISEADCSFLKSYLLAALDIALSRLQEEFDAL